MTTSSPTPGVPGDGRPDSPVPAYTGAPDGATPQPAPGPTPPPYAGPTYSGPTYAGPTYTDPQAPAQPAPTYGAPSPMQQPGVQQPGQPFPSPYAGSPYAAQPAAGQPLPQGMPAYGGYGNAVPGAEPTLDEPWYGIGFVAAVQRFFLKYATFRGRASRGEFWWAMLFLVLAGWALGVISAFLPHVAQTVVDYAWQLATIVPFVALAVRRLHDSDRSGWWVLLPGIPYAISTVSGIVWTVLFESRYLATLQTLMSAVDSEDTESVLAASQGVLQGMVPLLVASVAGLVYLIAGIVLMTARSKPSGVRFDAAPAR